MTTTTPKLTCFMVVDGDDCEVELPSKYVVCPRCRGAGHHVNPSIDGNGITGEEMDELGEDFRHDYISGAYDVPCEECNGRSTVLELDRKRATKEQIAAYEAEQDSLREMYAIEAAERRMGC